MGTGNVTDDSYEQGAGIGSSVITRDTNCTILSATEGWVSASVSASGVTLLDVENDELAFMGYGGDTSRTFGSSSSATKDAGTYTSDQDGYGVICWGIESNATTWNSGAQSMRELVAPTLSVDFYTDSHASDQDTRMFQLEVTHKVLTLTSISSSDGRVSQAIAS